MSIMDLKAGLNPLAGAVMKKAALIAGDDGKLGVLVSTASKKALSNKGALGGVWRDLTAFIRLLGAWSRGEYREVSWRTLVLSCAGLVYFVNPFDLVPDFIPISGFIDDALVIGVLADSVNGEIERFKAWESSRDRKDA